VFRGTWYLAAPAFAAIIVLVGRDANHGQIGWQGCQPWTNWLAGMPTMEIQGQLVGKDANHGQNWLARMPTMEIIICFFAESDIKGCPVLQKKRNAKIC
jgi:hypothetical protein